jgi:hypothetical protein
MPSGGASKIGGIAVEENKTENNLVPSASGQPYMNITQNRTLALKGQSQPTTIRIRRH